MKVALEIITKEHETMLQEIYCNKMVVSEPVVTLYGVKYTTKFALIPMLQVYGAKVECNKGNIADLFDCSWTIEIPAYVIHNMQVNP